MKKLIRNILVFIIPVIILISIIPVNNRFKYQGLKDDCFNHGIWIYDRIYNNENSIDVAFLGSSHTINGINDKLISDNIRFGQAVNLGYCRLGLNFNYVLLKEIISQKKIKHLILEVRENEDRYSHPIFPYIASSRDVMLPNPFFNRDILDDIWTHLAYKIEILQEIIYQNEKSVPISTIAYGFASSKDTASINLLDDIKLKRSVPKNPLTKFEKFFHGNFARVYLQKICKLCDENNIQITFLYLPSYGALFDKPEEYETYINYGVVLIPPTNILDNKNNWFDENHLNQTGADELSLWISGQINNLR